VSNRAEEPSPARHRRDAEATRAAILEAAAHRFAQQGYEQAGVRQIAADAGANAALVNRYFGSKQGLFEEVITRIFDIRPLIEGDRATLAERLARLMVYGREDLPGECQTAPILLLIRSMAEPAAARLLREGLERNQSYERMAKCIGGPDAMLRASLLFGQLTGFAFVVKLLHPDPIQQEDPERMVALFTGCLAACLG
jgi:AcrR family transcriptional regulator